MIYFRDKDTIIKSKIVSKNDEKLIEFVKNNSERDFKNLDFISSEFRRAGERVGWFDGWCLQGAEDINDFTNVINRFKFKKLITLEIVSEALQNNDNKFLYVSDSYGIELEKFFDNPNKDLEKIETIVDNPYFYDFLEKMYSDYSGFIEILPYIGFKTVDYYCLIENLHGQRLFESIEYGGESAKNNSKILTKTKEFMNRLDK